MITKAEGRMSYSEFVQLLNHHAIPARELTTDHLENIFGLLSHAMTGATEQTKQRNVWREIAESDTMIHLVAGGRVWQGCCAEQEG